MAISNIQDTLLMYTKQKAMLNRKLSDVMFNIMSASRESAELQQRYNEKRQDYYYEYAADDPDLYQEVLEVLEMDHEFELSTLNSWEKELELDKANYETRLNEITAYESSWSKLLQQNVKNDFTYGGAGK
ncbi:hypothetical protein IKU74_00810 [bacterium]|nr:hypothetical protein [bacterium]